MTNPIPSDPVLGYAELARLTGLSLRACRVRACNGELPFRKVRVGSGVVFDRAEVLAWVKARKEGMHTA